MSFITINLSSSSQRLDRFLKQQYPYIGYAIIQKWLRTGQIRLNGKRVQGCAILQKDDQLRLPPQVHVYTCNEDQSSKKKPNLKQDTLKQLYNAILLQTPDFIALNKPCGLATQGGTGITDAVSFYLNAFDLDESLRIIHRLDRDTSGMLILAKSLESSRVLSTLIATRQFHKYYLAVVVGCPVQSKGMINLPLGKMTGGLKEKMSAEAVNLSSAQTMYQIIDSHQGLSLICFKPITGRTHQIRVHSAEGLNCPIIGDGKYGGKLAHPFDRRSPMHLHAWGIDFKLLDQNYRITAPLPEHFMQTLQDCNFTLPAFKSMSGNFASIEKQYLSK